MDYLDPSLLDPESVGLEEVDYDNGYTEPYIPPNEFELLNNVLGDGIHKDKEIGLTAVTFDSHEELVWAGTKSGHVTSYYGTQLQKYTSFKVHPHEEVRSILTLDHGILALSPTSLRSQLRRGIPCFTHSSDNMQDMHSLIFNSRTGKILMGGLQNKLVELDLATVKETRVKEVASENGTCAILRDHSRYVISGDVPVGKIQLRDPNTLNVTHTFEAHSGGLSDFDVHGHHLVTCGLSRANRVHLGTLPQPDRFLMVYDLRILRAISPIQVHVVPYQLRFLPSMSSRIAVLSNAGQVQLVDTAALTAPNISVFQVCMDANASTLSMDISPSNQCLAFGDSSNQLYLFSSSVAEPILNPFSRETEFADPIEPLKPMDICDISAIYSSIPRPHLPSGERSYLSDYWPERFNKQAYRKTPDIDPEILRTMKIVGSVGYGRNVTNLKRNQVRYPNVKSSGHRGSGTGGDGEFGGSGRGGQSDERESSGLSSIPKMYRKIAIKLSKMGSDDFDFDRYNRSGFCGLEASLPNSYSNSMLDILYFSEPLRILMLNHTCNRENCICCELSFLFHMMDISPHGLPCQSSNFLRALRTIPEASALGLIFTDANAVWKVNVPRLVQSWNRFILQQIYNHSSQYDKNGIDTGSGQTGNRRFWPAGRVCSSPLKTAKPSTQSELEDISREISAALDQPRQTVAAMFEDDNKNVSIFTKLFGMKQEKVNVCGRCKEEKITQDTLLLCSLIYPETSPSSSRDEQKTSFSKIVASSLCPEQTTPAWCDQCRKYQPTNQTRNLKSLPEILSLNAGMDNPQDIVYWQTQMELEFGSEGQTDDEKVNAGTSGAQQQPPQNMKACRYGLSCTRPDCKFWHPEPEEGTVQQSEDISNKCARLGVSYIPHQLILHRHKSGKVSEGIEGKVPDESPVEESKKYNLFAICYVIVDPSTSQAHNIVSAINVGPTYHSRIASAVSQWYIFNDFSINPISPQEAVMINLNWKLPCLFFYQAEPSPTSHSEIKELKFSNPITADVFLEDKSLANRGGRKRITFLPLAADEMLRRGDLVAIDAEFVTLNQEESELRSDGKVSTIKAAQMSVARVTVVRGNGVLEGTPFIDDYISTQEQVVDYVTKFSGIKPGDLDANYSSKHLTTLKSTYKKLRYLVDSGVIFIGHGLKNDFRVINIVVPPEQVIDTVLLFHLPHHRMVSLKFLAWHFLDRKIQGITHCSVEDAVTALALYKKYLELKSEDRLIEALNHLYDHGKQCNWKTPEQSEEEEMLVHQQQLLQQHQQKMSSSINIRGIKNKLN